jgi:hypothetical protein
MPLWDQTMSEFKEYAACLGALVSLARLEGGEVGDNGLNLRRLEGKLGHVRVSRHDALRQCLGKLVGWIAEDDFAERQGFVVRALVVSPDRVTTGAVSDINTCETKLVA